jgi:hypothetical protein
MSDRYRCCADRDRCRCGPGDATAVRKGRLRRRRPHRFESGRRIGRRSGAADRDHGRCGAGHATGEPVRGDRRGHWPHSSRAAHGSAADSAAEAMAAQVQWLPTDRPAIGVAERDRK